GGAARRSAPAFGVGGGGRPAGPCLSLLVLESGRPARVEDYSQLPGTVASAARDSGITGAAGVPIVVDGAVWGMIWAGTTKREPLPDAAEARLTDFAELVAIAITNTQSREGLRRLADQQTSLRRVATLAAEGATSDELFAAVAEEAARILDVLSVSVVRFEPDTTSVVVGSFNDQSFEVGSRWPLEAGSLNAIVLE